jgi:transposase
VAMLEPLHAASAAGDARVAAHVSAHPVARRLCTVPGVGPQTAAVFVATLDDIGRFPRAGCVAAYLGLVPSERSSGERQRRGRLTKTGNSRARWVLVQAAWAFWRDTHPASAPLRAWAQRIAARRSKRVAVVALARRLAGILYALGRDGSVYEATRVGRPRPTAVAA